jgi:hypothetical protein
MKKRTVWKARAAGLALLMAVSGVVLAQGVHADLRNGNDPDRYRKLDGVWQCHFLQARNALEKRYYSHWTFEAAKKVMFMMWSPVHKGNQFRYAWDGITLILDDPWGPPSPRVGTFDARLRDDTELTIKMPALRWKGWICNRAPSEQWPDDKWQFLDYARYPWLSGLVEDGPSIMRYRDPKRYEEWLKGQPR